MAQWHIGQSEPETINVFSRLLSNIADIGNVVAQNCKATAAMQFSHAFVVIWKLRAPSFPVDRKIYYVLSQA